ncbi:coiled-coil domain-containing protein 178 [Pteronotus mesoamericanus]|uniref:coiled-coil domain-containing protein 178 n=1 Tax=Pteronotus mesoamericanus TaxID=1884717 RepID=UPI0023EC3728|nr:coiled-coil domain-containing protein 178 [Pteronotus parnellii mesoamericanus]
MLFWIPFCEKKDNATSQALVLFGAPKEAVEIFPENKMTNTEEVNKGIYFSYPCRRHSCSLVNIPAPCVNKMISHLEGVESKIQEHLKQFEAAFEEWSRTSTKDLKEDWSIDTSVKEVKPKEERDEKCPELKQEMETLLSEAIHLIKSLETDRAEAEEALKKQQSRRKRIKMTIDSWSIWRLQELPLAVQKEHEAFLRDTIELRWHLEGKGPQLTHLEEEKTKLEEANAKLQADIDYMNEHGPQLNSKLIQELEALKEYHKKKSEVMELYKQIHGELKEAIENYENTKLKAKQIREEMEKDIHDNETSIETFKKKIEQLNFLYSHYNTLIQNIQIIIEENEEAITEILKERKISTNELSALRKKLDDLKRLYDQLFWKKKSYANEYLESLNNFYAAKKTWDIDLSNITKDFSDLSITYAQLLEEKKKLEMDIETVGDAINVSIKRKSELESEIQSMMKLKSKNNEYLKQLYKEAYHVGAIFHLTKFKTEELEEQIAEVRRKFKGREDFLKTLTRGEVTKATMIQKNLYALQEKYTLEKQGLLKKIVMHSLILAEIQSSLLHIEADAARIRAIHNEQSEKLLHIIEERNKVKKNVERTKKKLRKKGKETQEALIETEEKCSMIFHEIETMKSKTVTYQAKIRTLNTDLGEKLQEKQNYDKILDNLKENFFTIRFKKEHIQAIYDHLLSEKKVYEERLNEEEQRYRTLVTMRQKTLADIKKMQDDSLEENRRLAQEYQKLQVTFLAAKDHYFNLYDRELSLDASIRDKKQLCQLQRRIQKVWQQYFKLVVLYSRMRLAKFQADSQESIQKILAVQEESSNLMQHIVDFFQTFPDGPCENNG